MRGHFFKRFLSILISASLITCNMPSIPVRAATTVEDDEAQEFTLTRADLESALLEALRNGKPVSESDYVFTGEEQETYERLFYDGADVYELSPDFEYTKGGRLKLKIFARMDGDRNLESMEVTENDGIIFLLLNNTAKELTARICIDEYATGLISVVPVSEIAIDTDTADELVMEAPGVSGSVSGSAAPSKDYESYEDEDEAEEVVSGNINTKNEITGEETGDEYTEKDREDNTGTGEDTEKTDNSEDEHSSADEDDSKTDGDNDDADKDIDEGSSGSGQDEASGSEEGSQKPDKGSGSEDNSGEGSSDSGLDASEGGTGSADTNSDKNDRSENDKADDSDKGKDSGNEHGDDTSKTASVSSHHTGILSTGKAGLSEDENDEADLRSASDSNWETASASDAGYIQLEGELFNAVIVNGNRSAVAFAGRLGDVLTGDHTLLYEGEDFAVKVTYGLDAGLPEGVDLDVSEYEKDSETFINRLDEAAGLYGLNISAINDEPDSVRLFDISLYAGDNLVEPEAEVEVEFLFGGKDKEKTYRVIHFSNDEETMEMDTETGYEDDVQVICFSVSEFSDFMVVDNDIMPLASGEAYVSSFLVTSQLDGSEPWDSDDSAGNDSNAENDIVRSFDEVTYTLSYATALTNPSTTVSSATLYAEFTLPCGPDEAYFDMNTVNWMSDAVTTYYLKDGSTKTTYENGDDVEKQVLTGHRTITAIPGSGDLSLGVNIGAAVNGTKLQPAFTAWMEGNEEEDKVSADVNKLTISAAPMYKLQVKSSSGLDRADTYDLSIGNGSKDTIGNKDSIVGRLEGYGITVMMENSSKDKGLKGMEFPKGDETITFDLTINETLTASDGTAITGQTSGWTPVIWDYDENAHYRNVSNGVKGKWDRTLYNYSWANGGAPANKLGQTTFNTVYDSCYDGGGWTITQDENDPLTYHVTIKDFTFDYADYNFPSLDLAGTSARVEPGTTYGSHQACFSAGYVQVILQYENASWVTESTKANLTITANNFKVDDTSYTASATATSSYQLIKPGSINTQIWFGNPGDTSMSDYSDSNTGILGSGTSNGDAYSFQGKEVRINARTWITGDTIGKTTMEFTKWDADCFDAQGVYNVWWSNSASSSFTNGNWSNSCTMYYAGRDNNWENEKEMSDTLINNESLTFYTSPAAVTAAGQVCVGGLLVADTYNQAGDLRIGYKTYIKDTAVPGEVYAACTEGWVSSQELADLEKTYGDLIGTDGKINTEIVRNGYDLYKAYCSKDVYATMGMSASSDAYYTKTAYDEHGNIISGTNVTACYGGNSLLICGEKTSLEIHTDREKYDMDSGQRTATVTVQPTVVVEGTVSSGSTTTTTVTIEVTLPADLVYSTGTAKWGDSAIVPVETTDSSGNTVLTFTLYNVTVGEDVPAITFECAIGHAGTAEDVYNNESISLSATIESTYDHRSKSSSFGNIASTSVTIIRLSSSSISKSVNKNFIEANGDFTWTLSYYNGSATDITGTDLADVFPKNNDDLGSKFSGSYSIESIVLDFSEAPNSYAADDTDMHFYVSADYDGGRDELAMGGAPTGDGWTDLMSLSTTVDDPDEHIVTLDTSDHKDICAFYLDLGNMDAYETISIEIKVQTNGNEPGDVYNNMFCEAVEGQNSDVKSIVVTTEVIEREINGRTWIDVNKNGIQDSTETGLSGVKVTLYNVDDGSETSDGQTSAEAQAKDVYGRTVEPVYTSSAGAYSFNNLPAGDYKVQFSDVNAYTYNLTEANVGTNDDIDSDATLVSAENGDLIAEIKDIKLPELEDMERALYESNHNDAGYVYDTIDIEGTKVWEDADDQDGIRPESILVYLLVDGTRMSDEHDGVIFHRVTPDENGKWTFRFTDLPRYSAIDGHEFVYNIEEIKIDGYGSAVTGSITDGFTITNTHTPETIDVSGIKTWDDSGDQDGYEPGSITIRLLADSTEIDSKTVTADVNGNWSWTFENLPKYRDGGEEIVYTITEDAIDHYSTTYDGYNVINTHTPDKTSVTVTKSWDDSDDQDGIRPAYVTVKLLADGEDTDKSLTLQESNNWTDTFTELGMYHDHGLAVAYTVEEVNVTGYDAVITGDATTGYTVTNTHTPETIDIKVTKSWNDADDQDGIRPESIIINLFADGTQVDSATVEADANGDWNLSFTGLPKYRDGGKEINYAISENEVNGYTTDITGDMANGYTITNSHTPETTEVSVRKAWDDADDQDGVRPESITVHLYADGVPVTGNDGVVYVTAADDWIWSFRDLPKYRDGGTN